MEQTYLTRHTVTMPPAREPELRLDHSELSLLYLERVPVFVMEEPEHTNYNEEQQ